MKCILIARTPEEKAKGLSIIPFLNHDEYALFIYKTPNISPYWNKDVNYPIDIGFYDESKKLIYKTSMEPDQRQSVFSPRHYSYVIETNRGELDEKFAF